MTNQHPITPPPELVASLCNSAPNGIRDVGVTRERWLVNHAYAAGADQELDACCEYLVRCAQWEPEDVDELRAARRPKPPSLKEQALDAHNRMMAGTETQDDWTVIRRALEALND
jgi:hypothetical protein